MKNTAVEWLFQKLWDEPKNKLTWYAILKQAKQMEKEQIMMAHCHNRCLNNKTYECSIKAFENSEQYFNETFNTEDK